jgi:hypothetical protein
MRFWIWPRRISGTCYRRPSDVVSLACDWPGCCPLRVGAASELIASRAASGPGNQAQDSCGEESEGGGFRCGGSRDIRADDDGVVEEGRIALGVGVGLSQIEGSDQEGWISSIRGEELLVAEQSSRVESKAEAAPKAKSWEIDAFYGRNAIDCDEGGDGEVGLRPGETREGAWGAGGEIARGRGGKGEGDNLAVAGQKEVVHGVGAGG